MIELSHAVTPGINDLDHSSDHLVAVITTYEELDTHVVVKLDHAVTRSVVKLNPRRHCAAFIT